MMFTFTKSLTLLTLLSLLHHISSSSDLTDLVYKGCADQKFQDPSGSYTQNLNTLLTTLTTQASQKLFSTTSQNTLTGTYQCRGDLSTSDCYKCIAKIPSLLSKLCGPVVAARVQLNGCYLRYEIVGFKEVGGTQLLYKVCGSVRASGVGFGERRETAFGMVENGVKSGNNLFFTGRYQDLYVLGQCEGDLSGGDCGMCVKSAEDQVKYLCGEAISAKVYLQKCYLSYNFYPNGVPATGESSASSLEGTGPHNTQKTVALAVGGVAALGFLIACLLFVKSAFKRRGGKY